MIRSNEVRVGNLVFGSDKKTVITVSEKDIVAMSDIITSGYYYKIPLSEEWLLKFGFKTWGQTVNKMAGIKLTKDIEFEIDLINGDFSMIYENDAEFSCIDIEIKFVHQLQNLYFILTGTELEIK